MQEKAKDLRPWTPLPVPYSKVLSVVSSFQQPLRVAVRGVRGHFKEAMAAFAESANMSTGEGAHVWRVADP